VVIDAVVDADAGGDIDDDDGTFRHDLPLFRLVHNHRP